MEMEKNSSHLFVDATDAKNTVKEKGKTPLIQGSMT